MKTLFLALQPTQVYAKIIDDRKKNAVLSLPELKISWLAVLWL